MFFFCSYSYNYIYGNCCKSKSLSSNIFLSNKLTFNTIFKYPTILIFWNRGIYVCFLLLLFIWIKLARHWRSLILRQKFFTPFFRFLKACKKIKICGLSQNIFTSGSEVKYFLLGIDRKYLHRIQLDERNRMIPKLAYGKF